MSLEDPEGKDRGGLPGAVWVQDIDDGFDDKRSCM